MDIPSDLGTHHSQVKPTSTQAPSLGFKEHKTENLINMLFSLPDHLQEADFKPLPKSQLREQETNCAICLLAFSDRENPAILLPCRLRLTSTTDIGNGDWRHVFCVSCIETWFEHSTFCPTCRTQLVNPHPHDDGEDVDDGDESNLAISPIDTGFLNELYSMIPNGNTSTGDDVNLNLDGVSLDTVETWIPAVPSNSHVEHEDARRMNTVLMANHSEEEEAEYQRWLRQHARELVDWAVESTCRPQMMREH